jgi:hypothetical protein
VFFVIAVLVAAVALAVLVTTFAAYPHRGEPIPYAGRLSEALMKADQKIRW